ncbi:hypothetical protein PRUPE_4G142000 [Prunus persica]|uniref:Vinorine synthase-like n=1 Tax=Prunus persica TaxID=3760 RepID=A0A251PKG6_PRUPE|nr:vinorine synthase-like [Prunus persica]ONI12064.1 hypothetical protein PRUPE_4G142000 [Prunus persica]
MNVQVEVISKEIIKPSSPTPNPLRHYKLSFLDQLTPSSYTSLVFFYEFDGETQPAINEVSKHLKKSLAKVLTLFYPLAGRVKIDDHFVDCNDEGIAYLEAQVTNCRLCDFLNNPLPDELNKFIPFAQDEHIANEIALGVQLNMFEGGFAIGLCTSHKLADFLCMLMFTKTWAAIARDEVEIQRPQFVSATLFPPKGITGYNWGAGIAAKKVTKRFVFDASTIEDLRAKYTGLQNNEKQPSPVEALSAFMWRRFVGATKDDHADENKLHSLIHSVDLRPLIDPPLSPYSFGNIYGNSLTAPFLSSGDDDDGDQESSYGMVRRVREAISKIDKDFVKRLQHGDEQLSLIGRLAPSASKGEVVTSYHSSLCQFPLYDNDFGWGRPIWVSLPPLPVKDIIVFLDTKEPGGVEAYVSLAKEVMTKFESDTFLRRRVGTGRVGSASSCLIHQPVRFNQVVTFHTRNRASVIKKPTRTKLMKLGSGSICSVCF